jgi:hypothetical protein
LFFTNKIVGFLVFLFLGGKQLKKGGGDWFQIYQKTSAPDLHHYRKTSKNTTPDPKNDYI